jgi:hypothetical protein
MSPLGSSVNRGNALPARHKPTRVVLKAFLSACRSLWAPGAAGTSSAASRAFERTLKER